MQGRQEVFNRVARHLLTQGQKAMSGVGNGCAYRAKDGLVCAIGCLIPDNLYRPSIESRFASRLIRLVPGYTLHWERDIQSHLLSLLGAEYDLNAAANFLTGLQTIHDCEPVEKWPRWLREFAHAKNLSPAVLDEFPDWQPKPASVCA